MDAIGADTYIVGYRRNHTKQVYFTAKNHDRHRNTQSSTNHLVQYVRPKIFIKNPIYFYK